MGYAEEEEATSSCTEELGPGKAGPCRSGIKGFKMRTWKVWHSLPLVPVLAAWITFGVTVAGAIFTMHFQGGRSLHHETLVLKCMNRAQVIQNELQLTLNIANMYVGLMKSGPNITQENFRRYSDSTAAMQKAGSAPGWIEVIPHSKRAAAEAELGTSLFNFDSNGFTVAPEEAYYAYVRFTSEDKYNAYKGMNFFHFKPGIEAIRDAIRTRQSRITLPYYINDLLQIGAVFPVFQDHAVDNSTGIHPNEHCMGLLIPSFPIMEIFHNSLSRLGDKEDMLVRGYDVSPDIKLMDAADQGPFPPGLLYAADTPDPSAELYFDYVVPFVMHGRQYELRCKKGKDGFWPLVFSALAWPTVVLAVVILSAVIMALMVKQIRTAESEMQMMAFVNEELREAKQAAEAADKAKSSFIATISHELRTPMTGVIGMTDLLTETELTPAQLDYVQTAQTSGTVLLSLLTDILDFSKIEAGHMELETVSFDLRAEVDDLLGIFAEKARQKGLELAALIHEAVPEFICGDQVRLRQVICNLLGNALKFTREGSVVITIRPALATEYQQNKRKDGKHTSVHWVELSELNEPGIRPEADEKLEQMRMREFQNLGFKARQEAGKEVYLAITVQDTGIGIERKVQPRLFQPFVQANSKTTREYGGTGIGLSISQRIVHLMGGSFWAASTPDVGSAFCFRIPVTCHSDTPTPKQPNPMKAYVLEASLFLTQAIASYLKPLGAEVEAVDLRECARSLKKLKDGKAVVILDWDNVGPEGLENLECGGIPLKVLVALTRSLEHQLAAQASGCPEALLLPLRGRTLRRAVAKRLGLETCPKLRTDSSQLSLKRPSEPLQGKRVLIVDDNAINRKVACKMLEAFGCVPTLATCGQEALDLLMEQKAPFDLVLMDCQMPEMDGYQATRLIREMEHSRASSKLLTERTDSSSSEGSDFRTCSPTSPLPLLEKRARTRLPVVALTADVVKGTREMCMAAGMDDYCAKPLDKKLLLSLLEKWLGSTSAKNVLP